MKKKLIINKKLKKKGKKKMISMSCFNVCHFVSFG